MSTKIIFLPLSSHFLKSSAFNMFDAKAEAENMKIMIVTINSTLLNILKKPPNNFK